MPRLIAPRDYRFFSRCIQNPVQRVHPVRWAIALHGPAEGDNAMLSIDWQASAAYGHMKIISPAGFAWDYLRRNDDYHRDFRALSRVREPPSHRLDAFTHRWGLRFPA